MITLRRFGAWVVDAGLITLVLAVALWRSVLTGWLYPYDGKLLGNVVVILIACLMAAFMNETVGDRLMGLKVRTIEGGIPPVSSRITRAFVLWFMILQTPTPPGFFVRLGIDAAAGLLLGFLVLAIAIIPLWIIASRGEAGFHDIMTATRVGLRGRPDRSVREVQMPRLIGVSLIMFATVASVYTGLAWSSRVVPKLLGPALPGPLQYLAPYVWSAGVTRMIQTMGDRDISPIEDYYTSPDNSVHFNGTTFYLAFPTTLHNVLDGSRAADQAYHDWWTVRSYLPENTRWVEVMLFASETLGFLEYSTSTRVLIRLPQRTYVFPPHIPTEGEKLKQHGFQVDSFPVAPNDEPKTVYFNQQLSATFGISVTSWNLLSVNYLRDREPKFRDDL